MTIRVQRDELVDYATYEAQRPAFRQHVIAEKARRRIHLGAHFTFLFENRLTIRYQVQEMMRAERLVKEADIRHELDTYNELLGEPGDLGCTLLIEIDDPAQRTKWLRAWLDLPRHIYLKFEDGSRVAATFDPRQVGEDRLSSVQYLRFPTGGQVPVAIGIADVPDAAGEVLLTDDQRRALAEDLAEQ